MQMLIACNHEGGKETRTRNNLCLQSLSTARGYDGTEVSVSPLWGPNDPLICRGICVGDVGQVEKEISTQHGGVPGAPSRPSHDGPRTRLQRAGIAGLSGKCVLHPGPKNRSVRVTSRWCAILCPTFKAPRQGPAPPSPWVMGGLATYPCPWGKLTCMS